MVDKCQSSFSNFIIIILKLTILNVDFEITSIYLNHDPSPPIPLSNQGLYPAFVRRDPFNKYRYRDTAMAIGDHGTNILYNTGCISNFL